MKRNFSSYLITGAGGLICSAFVDHLLTETDAIIYAAGRDVVALKKRFPSERVIAVRYDATKPIEFDFEVDVIVHGAA